MSIETLYNSEASVQGRTQTLDAWGGIKESFATTSTFRCRFQPTTADEKNLYSREGQVVDLKAYTSPKVPITINDQISFNSRTFIVKGIINPDEADHHIVLFLEEQA